jgi:hypothetical protein
LKGLNMGGDAVRLLEGTSLRVLGPSGGRSSGLVSSTTDGQVQWTAGIEVVSEGVGCSVVGVGDTVMCPVVDVSDAVMHSVVEVCDAVMHPVRFNEILCAVVLIPLSVLIKSH